MDRIEIINSLIKKNNYKTYLEIGVRNPDDCFNHIVCNKKHSVDPGVEGDFGFDFNMTSTFGKLVIFEFLYFTQLFN